MRRSSRSGATPSPNWSLSWECPTKTVLEEIEQSVAKTAASLPNGIPGIKRIAGWEKPLVAAMAALARLRLSYHQDPADVFVGNVRRELLIEAFEAARFQGRFRLANLNRFFRQLEAALDSEDSDVHAILRALRLGVLEAREAEEAMPRDAVEDAVQVMTIHTAKGLEFKHIYLVQMHSGTRSGGNDLLEAREINPGDWEYQIFKAPTLSYQRAAAKIQSIEVAEAVRTLYVALTRACERLVLIGRWPESPTPIPAEEAADYVDLVQNRGGLPASIGTLANDAATQLLGFHDQDEIRWRFLGNAQLLGASRKTELPASWVLDADTLRRHAGRRERNGREAQKRMGRRLTQPATAGVSQRLKPGGSSSGQLEGGQSEESQVDGEDRADALALGTALHKALETWDLERPPEEELERQRERLPLYFSRQASGSALKEGRRASGTDCRRVDSRAPDRASGSDRWARGPRTARQPRHRRRSDRRDHRIHRSALPRSGRRRVGHRGLQERPDRTRTGPRPARRSLCNARGTLRSGRPTRSRSRPGPQNRALVALARHHHRLPGSQRLSSLERIATPALLLDLDRLERKRPPTWRSAPPDSVFISGPTSRHTSALRLANFNSRPEPGASRSRPSSSPSPSPRPGSRTAPPAVSSAS